MDLKPNFRQGGMHAKRIECVPKHLLFILNLNSNLTEIMY